MTAATMADLNNPIHVAMCSHFFCMMLMIPEETRDHTCGYVGTGNITVYNPVKGPVEPPSYNVTAVIEIVSKFMWLA